MCAPNGPHILVLAVWINYIPLRTIAILIRTVRFLELDQLTLVIKSSVQVCLREYRTDGLHLIKLRNSQTVAACLTLASTFYF